MQSQASVVYVRTRVQGQLVTAVIADSENHDGQRGICSRQHFCEDSVLVWRSPLDPASGVKKFKGLPQQTKRSGRFAAQPIPRVRQWSCWSLVTRVRPKDGRAKDAHSTVGERRIEEASSSG